MGKNHPVIRVDNKFVEKLKELAKKRYIKGLAKKEPSMVEMSRLCMRTDNWKFVVKELEIKPRREDLL